MKAETYDLGDGNVRIKLICESSMDFRAKDSIENYLENKGGRITLQLVGRTLSNQSSFVLRRD